MGKFFNWFLYVGGWVLLWIIIGEVGDVPTFSWQFWGITLSVLLICYTYKRITTSD